MEIASFEDVLAFWFSEAQSSRWYANDDNFDAEIRQRFLSTYEAANSGTLDEWRNTPESLLASRLCLGRASREFDQRGHQAGT